MKKLLANLPENEAFMFCSLFGRIIFTCGTHCGEEGDLPFLINFCDKDNACVLCVLVKLEVILIYYSVSHSHLCPRNVQT